MIDEAQILDVLREVIDPDVGINIVDLGLVAEVRLTTSGAAVDLIMTTPACPQTDYLKDEARQMLAGAGIAAEVAVLEEPLWDPGRMSPVARLAMGWER